MTTRYGSFYASTVIVSYWNTQRAPVNFDSFNKTLLTVTSESGFIMTLVLKNNIKKRNMIYYFKNEFLSQSLHHIGNLDKMSFRGRPQYHNQWSILWQPRFCFSNLFVVLSSKMASQDCNLAQIYNFALFEISFSRFTRRFFSNTRNFRRTFDFKL